MTKHPLTVAMITAGVLAAGTAAALGLPNWLDKSETQPQTVSVGVRLAF